VTEGFADDGPTQPHRTLDPDVRLAPHGELTGDDLVAAAYADPDSDEPRLVYGDYLIEHDDPRGEFVQLQLARARDGSPVTEREVELFAAHGTAWCGPLYPALVPESIVFERGFLARCVAQDRTIALRDVIGHPTWITVVELTSSEVALVAHACMRSVVRLTTSSVALGALAVVDRPVRVARVHVAGIGRYREFGLQPWRRTEEDLAWRRIFDVGTLGALRALVIDSTLDQATADTRELLESKLSRQLTELEFVAISCSLAPWERILREHPTLRRIAIRGNHANFHPSLAASLAVLERDERGDIVAVVEFEDGCPLDGTLTTIASLPPTYRRVELRSANDRPLAAHAVATTRTLLSRRFVDVITR